MIENADAVLVVPVTPDLAEELTGTAALLAEFEKKTNRRSANNRDHYARVADHLKGLTAAMLVGVASTSLDTGAPDGARFSLHPKDSLNYEVHRSATYLRNTASELLASGRLDTDQYDDDHTREALAHLSKMFTLTVNAIVRAAEQDLAVIRDAGITGFLNIAGELSREAHPLPIDDDIAESESAMFDENPDSPRAVVYGGPGSTA